MNENQEGFRCPGHCFGLSKCPYAELFYENDEVVRVGCTLPKIIGNNTYLLQPLTYYQKAFADYRGKTQ